MSSGGYAASGMVHSAPDGLNQPMESLSPDIIDVLCEDSNCNALTRPPGGPPPHIGPGLKPPLPPKGPVAQAAEDAVYGHRY